MTEPSSIKWRQIADDLRAKIQGGIYPPGSTLPQLKAYASELGIHHETVRAAYKELEKEGLVRTIQRRGSVVLEPPVRRRITRGVTVTRDPARGYVFPAASRPDEPWQVHGRPFRKAVPAPPQVTDHFELEPSTEVLRRRRVTSPAGEPPFQLVDTWLSPDAVQSAPRIADPSPGPGGYLDRLEEAGHGPIEWEETSRVRMPDREEARLLEIAQSIPVLETTIVGTSALTVKPVEVTIRVIPGDRVELAGKLQRGESARWPVDPVEAAQTSD
ncbi:Mannosyl-D-glycerate transport/metabolism system repressor MngR [Streptomyces sp. ADI97-07]|uniref:GntR family transcriptional regulator n=1 Tax=Streptomyces sp. ADI97-07 TaxID=1522762 RepID=UPI000F555C4D|nr:GntR family transcriptional regulator [Streptomyces sp. ADI97-07]RPK69899.1 Mannosyl-D-glycerate transport/metabolism system repressor MngR [Streptomyces sp. ADI97-07]